MSLLELESVSNSARTTMRGELTVADAVWVGTATLHQQSPESEGFSTEDIVERVLHLRLTRGEQKSIWQHVNQHCVANRKPQPNRSRMLFALGRGNRRLFRDGDRSDPGREGAPTHPDWEKLPTEYRHLGNWYEDWNGVGRTTDDDPLLKLVGSGVGIWKDNHADEFVADLRKDWGGR